jgi:hypothetical protein
MRNGSDRRGPLLWRLKWIVAIGIFVLLAATAATVWFLFRRVTVDNSSLGLLSYRYSVGRLHEIAADVNRDGTWDVIARVVSYDNKAQSTGFRVREAWESTRLDGHFDVHYWRDEASEMLVLEYDSNNDGRYDTQLRGRRQGRS